MVAQLAQIIGKEKKYPHSLQLGDYPKRSFLIIRAERYIFTIEVLGKHKLIILEIILTRLV
jgi:hypothetical protein